MMTPPPPAILGFPFEASFEEQLEHLPLFHPVSKLRFIKSNFPNLLLLRNRIYVNNRRNEGLHPINLIGCELGFVPGDLVDL